MLGLRSIASRIFGTLNDRKVGKYAGRVAEINALEDSLVGLTDEALKARTAEFREQLAKGRPLDELLAPGTEQFGQGVGGAHQPASFGGRANFMPSTPRVTSPS